jgi:hypothetical protein
MHGFNHTHHNHQMHIQHHQTAMQHQQQFIAQQQQDLAMQQQLEIQRQQNLDMLFHGTLGQRIFAFLDLLLGGE